MLSPLPVKTHVKGGSDVPPNAVGGPQLRIGPPDGFESAVHAAMQEREEFSGAPKKPVEVDEQQAMLSPNHADAETEAGTAVNKDQNPSIGGDSTPSGIFTRGDWPSRCGCIASEWRASIPATHAVVGRQ